MQRFLDKDGWRWYADTKEDFDSGRAYISVTTALDCVTHQKLKDWQIRNTAASIQKTLVHTADLGDRVHKAVENDLKGLLRPELIEDDVRPIFNKWTALKAKHDIKAISCEKGVKNPAVGYAGTLDIYGEFDGRKAIMDIKTGTYSVKAGWQMAAYHAALLTEIAEKDLIMVGLSVPRRADKEPQSFVYQHIDPCYVAFLSAINCWRMLYFNKLKKMNWYWLEKEILKPVN